TECPMPLPTPQQPKLLDRVRIASRTRRFSRRTEDAYHDWCRRFILFHHKRHPQEMAEPEVNAFLNHLAVDRDVAASTQNQALAALLFLYDAVLAHPLDQLCIVRATRPKRLPVVLARHEVRLILDERHGVPKLVCTLLSCTGRGCGCSRPSPC